jgi:hypothetical protein
MENSNKKGVVDNAKNIVPTGIPIINIFHRIKLAYVYVERGVA